MLVLFSLIFLFSLFSPLLPSSSPLLIGFPPPSPIIPAYETCKKPAFCHSLPPCQIFLNLAPGSNAVGTVGQLDRQTPHLLKAHANTCYSAFLSWVNPTNESLQRGSQARDADGFTAFLSAVSCWCQCLPLLGGSPSFPGSLAGEGPALRPHRATDHLQPWGAELRFQEAAGCAGVLPALHHL